MLGPQHTRVGTMFTTACAGVRRRTRSMLPAATTTTTTTTMAPSIQLPQHQQQQVRNLNLHEFPTMELMRDHGIPTPKSFLASDADQAEAIFRQHFAINDENDEHDDPEPPSVRKALVKAQVLSGNRDAGIFDHGFSGGVRSVADPTRAREMAHQMLGHKLWVERGPAGGIVCREVLLVEEPRLKREFYLSILMDRNRQGPLLVGSALGGSNASGKSMSDIARAHPESIFAEEIDVIDGLEVDQCQRMAENLGLEAGTPLFEQAVTTMQNLYRLFVENDCTVVEINPLGETVEGTLLAVEPKIQIDDKAAFRQPELFAQRDWNQLDPREARAQAHGIEYIALEDEAAATGGGSIGCMVNGAGLCMATLDLVVARGGQPANFLDVGGGASEEQVRTALSILADDPSVSVVLVNIFGGLLRCDVVVNGILGAMREIGSSKPMVLRLQGTNYREAQALLRDECGSDYGTDNILLVDDLDEACRMAVAVANGSVTLGTEECFEDDELVQTSFVDLDEDPLAISAFVRDTASSTSTSDTMEKPKVEPRDSGMPLEAAPYDDDKSGEGGSSSDYEDDHLAISVLVRDTDLAKRMAEKLVSSSTSSHPRDREIPRFTGFSI